MAGDELSLAEVARAGGFADHAHVIHVFPREAGSTPGTCQRRRKPRGYTAISRTRRPATPSASRPCFSASASAPNTSRRQP
jgi:hypothetical protein